MMTKKVVFGNVSDKGRWYLVVDFDDVCFITNIGWTVARNHHSAGFAIKWNKHDTRLNPLSLLASDYKARGQRTISTLSMTPLTESFHADAEINVHPLPVL